jgi:hypothetical protein
MASFCAPSINIYSPDPKSVAGVKMKETSFVCIGPSEKDCSLKDPVELPRSPVGVNVPDDTILVFVFRGVGGEDDSRRNINFNFHTLASFNC